LSVHAAFACPAPARAQRLYLDPETEVVARFDMRREMAIGASLADPVPGAWSPDVPANRIA